VGGGHCAIRRNVAGSIPDGVNGLILLAALWPRGRLSLLGDKGGRCVGLTILPPACVDCLEILGASNSWSPWGLCRPVQDQLYLLLLLLLNKESQVLLSHMLFFLFLLVTNRSLPTSVYTLKVTVKDQDRAMSLNDRSLATPSGHFRHCR